jgi:hypothetical protein
MAHSIALPPPITLEDLPYAYDEAHRHFIRPGEAFVSEREATTQIALNRFFHMPPEDSELFEKLKRDGMPITIEKEDVSFPFEDYRRRLFTINDIRKPTNLLVG